MAGASEHTPTVAVPTSYHAQMPERPRRDASVLRQIPRGIWALGLVSLFMDVSSEMIHALLPVYLVTGLGASALTVGFIEGVAEATANVTKVFSGALSDWVGRRKLLAGIGYGMAALTKPIFAVATTVEWVVAARLLDRVGKGIRGAPRDALVADLAPPGLRAASFGLRQSLDTVGAFGGPFAAIALMAATGDSFRTVFWIAAIPALLSTALLVIGVQEPRSPEAARPRSRPRFTEVAGMGSAFWAVVAVSSLLTLARFSEAFLVLRAQDVGLAVAMVPLVMVVMNVAYALSAFPAGVMADLAGRGGVMVVGIGLLAVADVVLAFGGTVGLTLLGTVLWGFHMGFTQGVFATLVADAAPATLRGTAFGIFNLAVGLAMLVASVVAGALWSVSGPRTTFLAGSAFATLSLVGYAVLRARLHPAP